MIEARNLYIPYYNHIQFINYLISARNLPPEDKNAHMHSSNITIILNSCMILEGFLFTVLKDFIFIAEHRIGEGSKIEKIEHPTLFKKFLIEYSNRLDENGWRDYINLFELFTECKIDKKTEQFLTIDILFSFRNILIHGNEIELNLRGESFSKIQIEPTNRKLKRIVEYLKGKALLNIDENKIQVDLINNKIADHFFDAMKMFAIHLYELIPIEKRSKTMADMFLFYNSSFNSIRDQLP